ncbi:hypothetical protein V6N12_075936 [Hibiscus sabdariffa]|uniref:Uncharacterized protein n=1 Tax=Hibiscus sabdariffa TaxID=183260 RepID=A0ABR2AXS5_9ROSI
MHWMDARALRRKDAFRGERPWTETVLLGKRFYIPYVLTSVLLALNRIATPSLGRPNEFLLAEYQKNAKRSILTSSEKAFYPSPFLTFPGKETASTETSKEEDLERKLDGMARN